MAVNQVHHERVVRGLRQVIGSGRSGKIAVQGRVHDEGLAVALLKIEHAVVALGGNAGEGDAVVACVVCLGHWGLLESIWGVGLASI